MMRRALISGLTVAALALAGNFASSEASACPKDAKCRHGKGECAHHKGGKHGKDCDCKKCMHKHAVEAKGGDAGPPAETPAEKPAEAPAGE